MPNRTRRTANRGGSRRSTNLEDLDGALSNMIGSHSNKEVTVDASEERRFTMHSSNDLNNASRGIFAASLEREPVDLSGFAATHTSDFEKHQKNFSETKRIKP